MRLFRRLFINKYSEMERKYAVLVKNVSVSINYFRELFPTALEVKGFGRKRVLIFFASEEKAQQGLTVLQQQECNGKKCLARRFYKSGRRDNKSTCKETVKRRSSKATQTNIGQEGDSALPKISDYVRKLYGVAADLGFEQPPAPYLKYVYPKVTPDIVDAISITLMTNTRFYTQVLHLMNRMNLEPPFGVRNKNAPLPGRPKEVSTQTVDTGLTATLVNSESELETSEDENPPPLTTAVKRQLPPTTEQYKKKARLLLQSTIHAKSIKTATDTPKPQKAEQIKQFFESTEKKSSQIAFNVRPKGTSVEQEKDKQRVDFVPPALLSTKKLTVEEMKVIPIYQNYTVGVASNKLYIKNLSKDVTVEDIFALYERYVKSHQDLEVRVMQQGRMKGQAFVTFLSSEADQQAVVALALQETNGFLLREKPMVVCYGKK